jgi:hypothetical protein
MNEADWWTEEHTSIWERLKASLKRDWEHAKAAFGGKTKGSEESPSKGDNFSRAEPALRYGVGSSRQYPAYPEWDDALESRLAEEWVILLPTHPWDEAKENVRRGWEAGKGELKGQ